MAPATLPPTPLPRGPSPSGGFTVATAPRPGLEEERERAEDAGHHQGDDAEILDHVPLLPSDELFHPGALHRLLHAGTPEQAPCRIEVPVRRGFRNRDAG